MPRYRSQLPTAHPVVIDDPCPVVLVRNVFIHGRRTSIRMERYLWVALYDMATIEGLTISQVCDRLEERRREGTSLVAGMRILIVYYWRERDRLTRPDEAKGFFESVLTRVEQILSGQDRTPAPWGRGEWRPAASAAQG